MKAINFFQKNFYFFIFLIYFFIGISIVEDYGISIDEEFQRFSGFYWLCYVLEFLPFDSLRIEALNRLNDIKGFTLPNPNDFPFYGVVFDLPLAFLETVFKVESSKNYFLMRHQANFLIFFISSIYFYLIIKSRFKGQIVIFFGLLLYISSPRIFGDSFYNNKDLIFLSLVTISLYFFFETINNLNIRNLILFSFFAALTSALRILGLFLPVSFLAFLIIQKNPFKEKIFNSFLLLTFFLSFLILLWPYLWSSPLNNFLYSFNIFSKYIIKIQMLFNGDYIYSNRLPMSYLPVWILITTPLITLLLFMYGFVYCLKRLYSRVLKVKDDLPFNDFWRGKNEKKDLIVFFIFNSIFFYIILSSAVLYTGWRHLYFLHSFMIYLACIGLNLLSINFKSIKIIFFSIGILILFTFYEISKYHPFQSLYFNQLIQKTKKKDFEIDYWGLAGSKFLKEILALENSNERINIGVASYIPLERSIKLLNDNEKKLINIVGQEYNKAKYIFNNNLSEVNKFKSKKYLIPSNFRKISDYSINQFIVYEIYKKIN
tara:strand:- start:2137 stop:3768 length:1632 start_codon:yes stop_codon:yes gene_type:complete